MWVMSDVMLDTAGRVPGAWFEILDAGWGAGTGLEWLARYGRVARIDPREDALAYCLARWLDRLVRGSIMSFPIAGARSDLITMFGVSYHRWVVNDLWGRNEFR